MAAAVSSRAMAQQPLHPFFNPERRDERTVSVQVPSRDKLASDDADLKVDGQAKKEEVADIDEDPNYERRKRRCTTPPEDDRGHLAVTKPTGHGNDGQHEERVGEREGMAADKATAAPDFVVDTAASIPQTDGAADAPPAKAQTPTKNRVLRIRADGKLKSPGTTEQPPETKTKRKRKSGAKLGKQGICIKYGRLPHEKLAIGKKIDQILSGKLRVAPSIAFKGAQKAKQVSDKPSKELPSQPDTHKTTHPFFLAPNKKTTTGEGPPSGTDKKAASGTTSAVSGQTDDAPKAAKPMWPAGFGASFSKPAKVPGEVDAVWPPQGMQHVRGSEDLQIDSNLGKLGYGYLQRKSKGKGRTIADEEEVYQPQRNLVVSVKNTEALSVKPHMEASLHVPRRLFISPTDLQSRLKARLVQHAKPVVALPEHDSSNKASDYMFLSEAARDLFQRIESSLTAFETFDGDTQDWCHKYAPKRTTHLLQNQANVQLLRDWIRAMNVDLVDSGGSAGAPHAKLDAKKQLAAKRRKRKLKDELDDFVVSSEDEAADADELTEPETDHATLGTSSDQQSLRLRKLKPSGFSKTRAVLIVGPHGCGKSASVSAIAAELGFEIFEINAGVRRNGRDIMDRVGDMTKNHLVGNDRASESIKQDEGTSEPSLEESVDEKQQSVASFFKAKPAASSAPRRGRPPKKQVEQTSKPRKTQKQSLILLEEVDVLFEEDKPFWSAVFILMVQSRRPIIMTCSDERSLPLAEFVDTAVLRLAGPSAATLSEYLTCLAANEGHLLETGQVDELVRSRQGDVRASICDLQFWSQMAVGDERNGIRWFLDASAANKKRRQGKESVRLVSEDTLNFDSVVLDGGRGGGHDRNLDEDGALLSQASSFFGGAMDIAEVGLHLSQSTRDEQPGTISRGKNLSRLQEAELCSDALSAADTWLFSPADCDLLDASQPELSAQSRSNYVSDFTLLQADIAEEPSGLGTAMACAVRASVQRQMTGRAVSRKSLVSLALSSTPAMAKTRAQVHAKIWHRFEELTEADEGTPWNPSRGPGISVLHGNIGIVAAEVAPTVRAIALFDLELANERQRLAGVLEGAGAGAGRGKKRQRKTRAARAALEGGSKASTRRERWWPKVVDYKGMLATAGPGWTELALQTLRETKAHNAALLGDAQGEEDEQQEVPSSDPVADTAGESVEESVDEREPELMVLVE